MRTFNKRNIHTEKFGTAMKFLRGNCINHDIGHDEVHDPGRNNPESLYYFTVYILFSLKIAEFRIPKD